MKSLQEKYNEWRKVGEEESKDSNIPFTWDCGESSAREDFAYYWDMKELSYEEMCELENNYNR